MYKAEQREKFIDIMAKFTAYTGKHLPDDVYLKLQELRERKMASWLESSMTPCLRI